MLETSRYSAGLWPNGLMDVGQSNAGKAKNRSGVLRIRNKNILKTRVVLSNNI